MPYSKIEFALNNYFLCYAFIFGKSMQNSIYFLIIFIKNRVLTKKNLFFIYFRRVNNFFIKRNSFLLILISARFTL